MEFRFKSLVFVTTNVVCCYLQLKLSVDNANTFCIKTLNLSILVKEFFTPSYSVFFIFCTSIINYICICIFLLFYLIFICFCVIHSPTYIFLGIIRVYFSCFFVSHQLSSTFSNSLFFVLCYNFKTRNVLKISLIS